MGLQDIILGPIYLLIVFFIASRLKSRLVKDEYEASIYYKVFAFKLFAVTAFAFIYQFYYGGGDTFGFFAWTKRLVQYFFESPNDALEVVFTEDIAAFYKFKYSEYVPYYGYLLKYDTRELTFVKFMFFINLFSFNTYLAASYILSLIVFICNWALFRVFADNFPAIKKHLAISVLLLPGVAFWGGGFMKDSIAYAGICLVVYCFNNIFITGKNRLSNITIAVFALSIILAVRGFVVLSLLPAIVMWVFTSFKDRIKSPALRYLSIPILVIAGLVTVGGLINVIGNELGRFSIEELDQTVKDFQGWHEVASADGSGYTLHVDGSSPLQMLRAVPEAVNVTFFRPYLWESSGIVVLFSAIESTLILFFFLYVFFIKGKILGFIKVLLSSPIVQMCFIFAMLYGFSVGFTSYNFGALSRYKIPAMPFFVTMLVVINYKLSPKQLKK